MVHENTPVECGKLIESIGPKCSANKVTFDNAMNITMNDAQAAVMETVVKNGLETMLQLTLSQSTGLLQFNDRTIANISTVNTSITTIFKEFKQDIITALRTEQSIVIYNGNASMISLKNAQSAIFSVLQRNSDYTTAVTSLAMDIQADLKNSTGFQMSTLYSILGAVLGCLVLGLCILWLYRHIHKKNSPENSSQVVTAKPLV